MNKNIPESLLRRCSDEALKAHGTGYIFEKRAAEIKTKLNILNFFGIIGPVALGTTIATYDLNNDAVDAVKFIAGTIGFIQIIFTTWSMIEGWGDKASSYTESKSSNYSIAKRLKDLEHNLTLSKNQFESELAVIEKEIEIRNTIDAKHDIKDEEKRMGMRYGLRKYQRPCAGCKMVPTNMKPTDCGICGDFNEKK